MNQEEVREKAAALQKILSDHGEELAAADRELLAAIEAYHTALKEAKLKKLKEDISQS